MRKIILLLIILPLTQVFSQDIYNGNLLLTNFQMTNSINRKPFKKSFNISLMMSSFSMQDFSTNAYNKDKDPLENIRSINLNYKHVFKYGLGFSLNFKKQENYGWGFNIQAIHHIEKNLTNFNKRHYDIEYGFGILLNREYTIQNSFNFLFNWFIKLGNDMFHYFNLEVDGFFFVPWAPGYLTGDNNRFLLEGQFRVWSIGLYSGLSIITREEDETAIPTQYSALSLKLGFLFFNKTNWRLMLYSNIQQKAKQTFISGSNGYEKKLDSYRNVVSLGLEFMGRFWDGFGNIRKYSWGVDAVVLQEYHEASSKEPVFETSELELTFFFSFHFGF